MTQKTLGRKTISWMKLAISELTDEEIKVQSEWTITKDPKEYIPDDRFVPITESITDINSLLELYEDVRKLQAHRLDSTWDKICLFLMITTANFAM